MPRPKRTEWTAIQPTYKTACPACYLRIRLHQMDEYPVKCAECKAQGTVRIRTSQSGIEHYAVEWTIEGGEE